MTSESIAATVKSLRAYRIGPLLISAITGAPDKQTVIRWQQGKESPSMDQLRKMRQTLEILSLLTDSGISSDGAVMWLLLQSIHLDDNKPVISPAEIIRDGNFDIAFEAAERLIQ